MIQTPNPPASITSSDHDFAVGLGDGFRVGAWPGQPDERRAFFVVNKTGPTPADDMGYVIAVDPDAPPPCGTDPCVVDPATVAIGTRAGASPFWGPGAAVRLNDGGATYGLGYAVASGAIVDLTTAPTWNLCRAGEYPAMLHLYSKAAPADPSWQAEGVMLTPDPYIWTCFNQHEPGGPYEPIDAISGVVAGGPALYVATTDDLFWEYHSVLARQIDASEWRVLGYVGHWPRFRRDNFGTAR